MKRISILGSTGSIGTQALEIIDQNPHRLKVVSLSCSSRIQVLEEQIKKYRPKMVSVEKEEDAGRIRAGYPGVEVVWGREGLNALASMEDCDMVLNSLMGMRGLEPTLSAIDAGKDIAFANKETLVAGGELVMDRVRKKGVRLLPVDSEHSAIFQCLEGAGGNPVRRILLTASGGPFRGFTEEQLAGVELEDALAHPNWDMGAKITVDSATMMNKGLEIIEAKWLFDMPLDRIHVLIHPQSILHSAVEFEDGSVIGQMGWPDMKVPISYAFSWPERFPMGGDMRPLDLFSVGKAEGMGEMTFHEPDRSVFRTLDIAVEASRTGGSAPAYMNGANEALVGAFLDKKIRFIQIRDILERMMEEYSSEDGKDLESVLEADEKARIRARELTGR